MTNLQTLQKKLSELKARKARALKELEPKKRRGRPKGSINKQKTPQKRGRPKSPRPASIMWIAYPGVAFVQRKPGPRSDSHRWVAVLGNQVIGYYTSPEAAAEAYNEKTQGN